MKDYRNRILDEILAEKLESAGAVLVEGPKWCGKTTTAEQPVAKANNQVDISGLSKSNPVMKQTVSNMSTAAICAAKYAADASMNGELDTADPQGILDYYVQSMSGSTVDWNSIYH